MTLDELAPDTEGEVVRLDVSAVERRRLLELGVLPGTRIRPVATSPLGDPVAYDVRGAVIALRQAQARGVVVRPWSEAS